MTPSRKLKLASSLASVLSAVAMSGVATNAHAYAYAQGDIFIGNALLTLSPNITISGASNTAQVNGGLDGFAPFVLNQTSAGPVSRTGCSGPGCGAYAPTPLTQPTPPSANFAGATSTLAGSLLVAPGAQVTTDATASLASAGNGTAGSQLSNNAGFTIAVGANGGTINLTFDARAFQRTALSQPQVNAAATIAQSFTIAVAGGGAQLLRWLPNGGGAGEACAVGVLAGFSCAVTSSPFDLNNTINETFATGDSQVNNATTLFGGAFAPFSINVTLPAGTYNFGAGTQVQANAQFVAVPEPGPLSLLGAAFLGLGWVARRRSLRK